MARIHLDIYHTLSGTTYCNLLRLQDGIDKPWNGGQSRSYKGWAGHVEGYCLPVWLPGTSETVTVFDSKCLQVGGVELDWCISVLQYQSGGTSSLVHGSTHSISYQLRWDWANDVFTQTEMGLSLLTSKNQQALTACMLGRLTWPANNPSISLADEFSTLHPFPVIF